MKSHVISSFWLTFFCVVGQSTLAVAEQEKPPPVEKAQDHVPGIFLKSHTPDQESSFEIMGFEADNHKQSRQIVETLSAQIKDTLHTNPKAKFEVVVRTDSSNLSRKSLDYEAYALADQLAHLDPRIQVSEQNIPVDPLMKASFETKRFFRKGYKMSLALLRGGANATITTVIISAQLPIEAAITIGLVAGSMSFALQNWSEQFYRWAYEKTGIFAKYFGHYRDTTKAAFLNKVESYGRLYLAEVVYVGILHAAISALNPNNNIATMQDLSAATSHVLLTSLWGFTQDTWDLSFTETRLRMEKIKALTQNQIDLRTNLKYFSIAATSMALLVAQLLHVSNTEIAYISLGVAGAGAYARTLLKSKKVNSDPTLKDSIHRSNMRCQILVKRLNF